LKVQFIQINLFLFLIVLAPSLGAEEKSQNIELTLNAAYFTHNTTMPFTSLSFSNPGIDVNLEGIWNKNRLVSLLLNSSLGWYYHAYFANAFLLDFAVGCRIKPEFGLFFNFDIGLGYQLAFLPVYMYELNENGEYVRDKVVTRSSLIIPVSIKLGYVFEKMKYPVSIFVKYKWFIQTPYIDIVQFLPHGSLHFGVGIRFKSISKNTHAKKN
jgi:hypothetical protein